MNAESRTRTLLGKSLVRGLRDLAILCLVLFGIAGRVDWPAAWLVIVAAVGVMYRCAAANHFLSGRSRIQSERGHTVVQYGPYRFVRHPLYASRLVLTIGLPLTLGSWIALVPAVLNALLLVLRTSLEDRLLTTGLPGYGEYAKHVPERLVPGLW